MTSSEPATRRTSVLFPGAHRLVRRLATGEGPFDGTLVTDGESRAVLRDAEGLAGWGGWPYAGARHIAAPLDVIRRVDGHDVLLPWCTEKVSVFLGRRAHQGSALSGGEVSTLAVSVLRGIGELSAVSPGEPRGDLRGEWWLTYEGCPVLVLGDGEHARLAGAAVLEIVAVDSVDRVQRRVLEGVADGLRRHAERPDVPRRQLDIWEAELLAVAAPRPLAREVESGVGESTEPVRHGVGSAAHILPGGGGRRMRDRAEGRAERRVRPSEAPGTGALASLLGALVEAGGETVVRARTRMVSRRGVDERGQRPGRTRGATSVRRRVPKLAVGVGAAGAVLAAGLLWPTDASDGRASEVPPENAVTSLDETDALGNPRAGTVPPTVEPTPAGADDADVDADDALTPDPATGDELEQAASRLVSSIHECVAAGDEICATAVVSGASHVVTLFEGGAQGDDHSVRLVDEYGGAAVTRLSSQTDGVEGAGAGDAGYDRMLVLVHVDEKWLVRDAYDVADQPG